MFYLIVIDHTVLQDKRRLEVLYLRFLLITNKTKNELKQNGNTKFKRQYDSTAKKYRKC